MHSSFSRTRDWTAARHAFGVAQLEVRRLRLSLLLRRFNPNQPRIPAGQPGGGEWTSGGAGGARIDSVNWRARRSGGTRVIRGQTYETTASQELRLMISEAHARSLIDQVWRSDPDWRPNPSISEGVEGEILTNESNAVQASARLRELEARQPVCRSVGYTNPLSTGERDRESITIHTVPPAQFRELLATIIPGTEPVPVRNGYPGQWFRQPDGSIFGLRWSERYGVTLDVIRSTNPRVRPGDKVHQNE